MTHATASRPVFCIVTPSFNQAEYLEQTIRSVVFQEGRGTDFDLQYAVIDGGSRDGSVNIIKKYADHLTFWCSEKDRGQAHAINKGFDRVDGDLCAYLNSDDYYLPGAFRRVLSAHREHPRADLLHGICEKVDAEGEHVAFQISTIKRFAQIVDLWNYWLHPKPNHNLIQPEVFWTRRFREQVGRFDETLHYTMDFDYWLRGLEMGLSIHPIETPLAAFRIHALQKTSARNASILELLDRITPYLTVDDRRLSPEMRRRLGQHIQLTRRVIDASTEAPERRVAALLSLAAEDPGLLRSRFYWRHLRRSGKRVFWKRSAA